MKEFSDVSRAATCASGVILESRSPESVVAKRRDSVQKPYGMTSVWGGRTATGGFTLMELLVVVLIIGILAGVALPQYETAVLKSKMNSIVPLVRAIKNANEVYYMANGKYTDNLNDLDISIPAGNSKSIPTAGRVEYDNGTWIDQYVEGDCRGDLSCPRVWGGFGGRDDANKNLPNCVVAFYYDNTTTPGRIQCSGSHSKCAKICKGMNL